MPHRRRCRPRTWRSSSAPRAIRDAFFADGGTRPRFRLDITPVSADAATRQVTLDLDGTTIVYTRGAQRSTQVTWPSFSLQPTMRLVFEPPAPGEWLQETGPWALFRLFGLGQDAGGSPGPPIAIR